MPRAVCGLAQVTRSDLDLQYTRKKFFIAYSQIPTTKHS